jgi:hypothetical protein
VWCNAFRYKRILAAYCRFGVADAPFHSSYERVCWKVCIGGSWFVPVSYYESQGHDVPWFSPAADASRRHLRTFFAVMILIAGSSVVGGNLARFAECGRFHVGQIAVGGVAYVFGIVLWLRTILDD